jgi:serine/threonine protein kinase
MASHPQLKYSHNTFVFLPLKNPEIAQRRHLLDDKNHESSQYLQAHKGGFIFLRWLQNRRDDPGAAVVGLFASVDHPQELVVVKKLRGIIQIDLAEDPVNGMSGEIEQCSLADPMVQRQLPLSYDDNMELTAFPQFLALQVHDRGKERWDETKTIITEGVRDEADVTLVQKYYNGGTLSNVLDKYVEAGKMIPEAFIWHILAHAGRALSWLHTGHIPKKTLRQKDKAKKDPNWKPICHHDLHAHNIFLHYPTDEEKKADPRLEQFNDSLPQIIVGDFGLSFQAHNDRRDLLCTADQWHQNMPEPETLMDKADLGHILIELMQAHKPQNPRRTSAPEQYSTELRECWDKFWLMHVMIKSQHFRERLEQTRAQDWAQFPSNDYVYGTMISHADQFLDFFIARLEDDSVRWTQPTVPCMPWQSRERAYDRCHRVDWRRVMDDMIEERDNSFAAFKHGSIEIRQAHMVGAGTAEKELPQVDYGPRRGVPRLPPRKAAAAKLNTDDPDDLPDYSDLESGDDDAGGSGQAQRATVQLTQNGPVRRLPEGWYWPTELRVESRRTDLPRPETRLTLYDTEKRVKATEKLVRFDIRGSGR